MKLKEQVAIVTGAGRGIGVALAKGLAREGAAVVVADVLPENAAATARQIEGAGGRALGLGVDVSKPARVQAMIDAAIAESLAAAERDGVAGKRLTPYLLARLARVTGGAAIAANRALARSNATVGAALAVALASGVDPR
jgi:NAD(P)-dependent dehydrogenase (short-subunit alcohol dehydrogenase family)